MAGTVCEVVRTAHGHAESLTQGRVERLVVIASHQAVQMVSVAAIAD
jgi:hypothetical protein